MDAAVPAAPGVGSPPGLDLDRLHTYLNRACPGLVGDRVTAEIIAGGRSNLTYRLTGAGGALVLRRPPLGHVLPTAHDMAREFRVIAALYPTGFPVPVPLHLCPDAEVIGAPFYLMSHVDGWVLRGSEDVSVLTREAAARAGELLARTLADLHDIEPAAVGLVDFGRPAGFLERQVRRWYQQWERSKTRELVALEKVTAALRASIPTQPRAAIVHGDYRLDNVMVDAEVGRILAVLDWEMATLGDPLADVGLLVVYTELAAAGLAPTQPRLGPDQGFLTAAELVDRYAGHAPWASVDRIGWYVALGYYKLAVISEGIHARYLQGKTVGAGFDQMGSSVPILIDRAQAALAG
jgi:aminoglycoside phosphotransferase (APT) family kinase protein